MGVLDRDGWVGQGDLRRQMHDGHGRGVESTRSPKELGVAGKFHGQSIKNGTS